MRVLRSSTKWSPRRGVWPKWRRSWSDRPKTIHNDREQHLFSRYSENHYLFLNSVLTSQSLIHCPQSLQCSSRVDVQSCDIIWFLSQLNIRSDHRFYRSMRSRSREIFSFTYSSLKFIYSLITIQIQSKAIVLFLQKFIFVFTSDHWLKGIPVRFESDLKSNTCAKKDHSLVLWLAIESKRQ